MVCNISYHTLIGIKPLSIRSDKVNGFIRVHGTRYLALFGPEKYDTIYDKIRYLIILTSCIAFVISHYYVRIEIDSCEPIPLEKKHQPCIMLSYLSQF